MIDEPGPGADAKVAVAAILCGGQSRRMGVDKAGLTLGGVSLLDRVWQRVETVADHVVAVGVPPGGQLPACGRGPVVPDHYPGGGALGGIATALEYALSVAGDDAWVLCVACDMPFLSPAVLRLLTRAARPPLDIVVPRTRAGYEPLCAVYRADRAPDFVAQLRSGNLRIFDVYKRLRVLEVGEEELRLSDPELSSFWNLNTPGDLAEALRRAEAGC